MDVTRDIAAPVEAVWAQLARTHHWPRWGPSIRSVHPPDATVSEGMAGAVTTAIGVRVSFEITRVVPGRRWSWRVAGVSATDHLVEPTADGCRATIRVPWWAPAYAPVCHLALRRIAAAVEAEPSAGPRRRR